ncbi:MAG: iron-containing alcohol dehydrogenase [Coriobacteriales bacterium]
MPDYSMKCPVFFGPGSIKILGERAKELGGTKAMLICDPNLGQETYDKAIESVTSAGLDYVLYNKTKRDAPIEVIDECGEIAKSEGVDFLVGIGGGSTLDTAKATTILLEYPGPIKQYILGQPIQMDVHTPMILMPTTAGTGSECTKVAVVNRTDLNMKWSVFVKLTLAIIDPELTVTLPPDPTAYTGMDAMAHSIEGITSTNRNPYAHACGIMAIRHASRYLLRAYHDGSDMEARIAMSKAAHLGGLAFDDPMTHFGHATADGMSITLHTEHGVGCGLALPEVCDICGPVVPDLMLEIAEALEIDLTGKESAELVGNKCAEKCRNMMHEMKLKGLAARGFDRDLMATVANETEHSHLASYSPIPVDRELALKIAFGVYDHYQQD